MSKKKKPKEKSFGELWSEWIKAHPREHYCATINAFNQLLNKKII